MVIIWSSLYVTFIGSMLLLSLSRRSTRPAHWIRAFSLLVSVHALIPFSNFYQYYVARSRARGAQVPRPPTVHSVHR